MWQYAAFGSHTPLIPNVCDTMSTTDIWRVTKKGLRYIGLSYSLWALMCLPLVFSVFKDLMQSLSVLFELMQFFNVSVPLSFKLILIGFIQRQPTTSSNCSGNKDFSLITRDCCRHLQVYNLWHLLFPSFAVFCFFKASQSFKINILSIPTSKSLRQDEVCFEGPAFPVCGFLLLTLHTYPTPLCLMWLVSGPRC